MSYFLHHPPDIKGQRLWERKECQTMLYFNFRMTSFIMSGAAILSIIACTNEEGNSGADVLYSGFEYKQGQSIALQRLWPKGEIPYVLAPDFHWHSELEHVKRQLERTQYVRMIEKREKDTKYVTLTHEAPPGGWPDTRCGQAPVGRSRGTVRLRLEGEQRGCARTEDSRKSTLLHEMLHVAGACHQGETSLGGIECKQFTGSNEKSPMTRALAYVPNKDLTSNDIDGLNMQYAPVVAHVDTTPNTTSNNAHKIIGSIDGLEGSGKDVYAVGWACFTGYTNPAFINLGVAGNEALVNWWANLDSEAAVNQQCSPSSSQHRFRIKLTDELRNSHPNKPLLVSSRGTPLARSGVYTIPERPDQSLPSDFDVWSYAACNEDLIKASSIYNKNLDIYAENLRTHFRQSGRGEGRRYTKDCFDGLRYIESYDDLIRAYGGDSEKGTLHYAVSGHLEGRAPYLTDGPQEPVIYSGHELFSGHFKIQVKHSQQCIVVASTSTADFAQIQQGNLCKVDHPAWTFYMHPLDDGTYTIQPTHSLKCLDVGGWSKDDWAPVFQYSCHYGDNQRWWRVSLGNGYYKLKAKHSDKCLGVASASQDEWMFLEQQPCTDNWEFQEFRPVVNR